MKLNNQTAILTGATGGIGQAIARTLNANGINLILVGRSEDTLEHLKASLQSDDGAKVMTCIADIGEKEGRKHVIAFTKTLDVQVNMLINNAGINEFTLYEDQTPDMIEQIMHINAIVPMLLVREFLDYANNLKNAEIINVGSTFGSIGYPGYTAYSSSKFALRGFTEALAREMSDSNIRIRYFSPRATVTSLNSSKVVEMNEKLHVQMDSPEFVAEQMLRFIKSKEKTMYLGWPEKLFVRINQLFPSVVSNAICKNLPIIKNYAAGH